MDIVNLIKSSGARNFAKLLSANVVAQVIGLIVYPILTRIYSPEDFGLLNLFLSIGNVLVVISLADYYYAIVLPKNERDAVALTHTSLFLLLITKVIFVKKLQLKKKKKRLQSLGLTRKLKYDE